MPDTGTATQRFLIVVEETTTTLRRKVFEAEDLEEAIHAAESETWSSWEKFEENGYYEVREDLSGPKEPDA
jgi:hypothetical protein